MAIFQEGMNLDYILEDRKNVPLLQPTIGNNKIIFNLKLNMNVEPLKNLRGFSSSFNLKLKGSRSLRESNRS